MVLAAVGEYMGGTEREKEGQVAPQPCMQDGWKGAHVTVTGQFQQVNRQTTAVHLCDGILLGNKKEQTIDTHNRMDEPQIHYVKRKKPDPRATYV